MLTCGMIASCESATATPSTLRTLCALRASALSVDFHPAPDSHFTTAQFAGSGAHDKSPIFASDNLSHNSFIISVYEPSVSVDSKALRGSLSSLESTFTRKPGAGPIIVTQELRHNIPFCAHAGNAANPFLSWSYFITSGHPRGWGRATRRLQPKVRSGMTRPILIAWSRGSDRKVQV
jgi:hypothetical protein